VTLPERGLPEIQLAVPSRRRTLAALGVGALVVLLLGLLWLLVPQPIMPEAEAALASTSTVTFSDEGDWLAYVPTGEAPTSGIVLYPGAKVPAEGYAPTALAIAERGYAAFVVKMPLNLAFLGQDRADAVREANPGIQRWSLWGHSLGGAFAATHVLRRPGVYGGLVFCSAYPNGDLSAVDLLVTSAYGTLDNGTERITSPETRAELPADTTFVPIEGGNHENCGWYTGQPNDPEATISRAEQQAQIVEATVALLEQVAERIP
jgi:hypothetical protein